MIATMIPVLAVLGGGECCPTQSPRHRVVSCCSTGNTQSTATKIDRPGSMIVMEVELLALDLSTCDRCTNTEAAIEPVIDELRPLLAETGVELRFRKTVVKTADEALALRFETSPTVRINGRDIPIEFRESRCDDCTTLCGGDANTDCRVWVWRGREYTAAPKGLMVDAILRAYSAIQNANPPAGAPYSLPDNLRRFFEAKRQPNNAVASDRPDPSSAACCDTNRVARPAKKRVAAAQSR